MNNITKADLKIIVGSAFQMAQKDAKIDAKEMLLLKKIIQAGKFSPQELEEIKNNSQLDNHYITENLSSAKAKKVLLLTLATVALSNGVMDAAEKEFLEDMSGKMAVGNLNFNAHTAEECETMVLQLISEN